MKGMEPERQGSRIERQSAKKDREPKKRQGTRKCIESERGREPEKAGNHQMQGARERQGAWGIYCQGTGRTSYCQGDIQQT